MSAIFLIIVAAAVILIATLDWNKAKPYIISAASQATGRKLAIDGDLRVDFGWLSTFRASEIKLQNADWAQRPHMAEVGLVEVQLDLWQLLSKFRVVVPHVTISGAHVILEKNADGAANWEFRAAVPEKRTNVPVIEKLTINDGSLLFVNKEANTRTELNLAKAEAAGFLQEPVKLKASGAYQKLPMTLTLDGGSYQNLKSSEDPYPLQINLDVGKLKARIRGNLTEPMEMKGEDVTLDIQGDDMANLFPLIRLVLPSTPPYALKGHR